MSEPRRSARIAAKTAAAAGGGGGGGGGGGDDILAKTQELAKTQALARRFKEEEERLRALEAAKQNAAPVPALTEAMLAKKRLLAAASADALRKLVEARDLYGPGPLTDNQQAELKALEEAYDAATAAEEDENQFGGRRRRYRKSHKRGKSRKHRKSHKRGKSRRRRV